MDVQAALDLPDETDAFLQISDIIYDKVSSTGYDGFSTAEKYFYCIDGLIRGMGSGGISHYFYDDAGAYAEDALQALDAVKAERVKKIVQDALACFPESKVPFDPEDRESMVSELEEQHAELWEALSDRFFDNETALVKQTLKYVSNHLKEFH